MEVKYRRNIVFLEARKMVKSNIKDKTNASVAQKASPISNNDNIMAMKKGKRTLLASGKS